MNGIPALIEALHPLRQVRGHHDVLFHNIALDLDKGVLAFAHGHEIHENSFEKSFKQLNILGFNVKRYFRKDLDKLQAEFKVKLPGEIVFSGAVKIVAKNPSGKKHLRELHEYETRQKS